ncbi:hypothetical protein [Ardenticatena maritima]|uniref:hypothetical protein n=1 Tax=Ardenticatena maritima TaxID=872965 RepID=UPI00128EB10F|nr:hypothetical protein [Ardenticatena maritima]
MCGTDSSAAGASAARYKLARFLNDNGFKILSSTYGCPPSDEDFLNGILKASKKQKSSYSSSSELVIISFYWWQATHIFKIPRFILDALQNKKLTKYSLFSIKTSYGKSTFFLTINHQNQFKVYRYKYWQPNEDVFEIFDVKVAY